MIVKRVAILVCLSLVAGCSTIGTKIPGVNNFDQVEPGLLRGAQPSSGGFKTLADRGVKTVIDLRDDARHDEKQRVTELGMNYVWLPSNAAFSSPDQASRFLHFVQSSPRPIFVHCKAGCDRTGQNIAVYRIVMNGWTRQQAIDELYAHGYHWMLFPNIEHFLKTFQPIAPGATASNN